jgi:hypothetical protein
MLSVTQTVFFEKPKVLYVDEDYSVKPPAYGTIDKLMKSLQENGPLIAVGKMGPSAYTEAPFKLRDKVDDEDIYGWNPLTSKEHAVSTEVILLGARKTETNAYVYFTLAKDVTRDKSSLIRGFKPSDTDGKVYIMSYENFLQRSLVDLHPICPHGQWLFSVPVDSILDGGETEEKCKQIGQQIFDHYKTAAKGNSEAGRSAVIRICEAARVLTYDGSVRKSHIERAWDGVGDLTWQWSS